MSEEEGERLLRIVLEQSKNQINSYLDDTNQVLDQNAYDAVMDLFYNRNSNKLTQEVIDAMAERDDEKVWSLLEISIIDMHIRIFIKIMHKKQKHM